MTITDPRPRIARVVERVLRREVADYTEMLGEAAVAARELREGTLWKADRDTVAGDEFATGVITYASEHVQHLINSMHDHIELIDRALSQPRLLFVPAWTAARAVVEAVLSVAWLMDAEVPSEMRVARAATLLIATPQGTADMHRRLGEDEQRQERIEALQELVDKLTHSGFEIEWAEGKRGHRRNDKVAAVKYGGEEARLRRNFTSLAERYMPVDAHMYGMLSGASHGEPWLLPSLRKGDAATALRAIMTPLFPASDVLTRSICSYFAFDGERYARKRRTRLLAVYAGVESP